MIIGVPNVGKSLLINTLRRRYDGRTATACAVRNEPGVTRHLMHKIRVHSQPNVFVYDTPGVLSPFASDAHTAMKLAACQTVSNSVIEVQTVADYLLWRWVRFV